jgi:hypothetical protein
MCNPGYYAYNAQGNLYGPYHNVYPPFDPWQGMLLGPQFKWAQNPVTRQYVPQPVPGPAANIPAQVYAPYGMAPGYMAYQQPGPGHPGGYPGLWNNPFVRSPRDFFMYGDDPADSPYRYGGASSTEAPITTYREITIGVGRVGPEGPSGPPGP